MTETKTYLPYNEVIAQLPPRKRGQWTQTMVNRVATVISALRILAETNPTQYFTSSRGLKVFVSDLGDDAGETRQERMDRVARILESIPNRVQYEILDALASTEIVTQSNWGSRATVTYHFMEEIDKVRERKAARDADVAEVDAVLGRLSDMGIPATLQWGDKKPQVLVSAGDLERRLA